MRERRANNMPKQLNVDLRFNADTSQAKKQIQDLQASLTKLNSVDTFLDFKGTDAQMQSAMRTVSQLKSQLQSAFNVDTGKLDLTRFTAEMQKGGMSLEKYRQQLTALGPEGTEAFNKLASAVSAADVPLRQTNKLLAEMGTVLKNTIRWQISSSMIHGFMGAIQKAYGYAQDLNESLTNIRIVTGQSTDQMAAFAAQANKAAQALSTTTTAYTDAALIFYQQGLSDNEVEERTNAVIKMSQATGDAATEVSSYMTAVWNNFDNGSESLEHYADVITALGAATASSSSEIAQGLEKFASIADTVGLSYEYATTALATVVAQTRQSADVVGTAFKTMFARFQDLELGKTLEDGTDLGQYSKALAKVGVDIKDANGGLRDMNDILDDLGAKWATLADDQKVALAQNVAGQRQYAQLVALMDNWDKFQENLITANSAEGTLQEQADIYADSWEAAQKRVQASMESIYQSIIDDKFFIDLNNTLASTLKFINNLIKSFGGLPGIISAAGVLLTKYFGPQMANGIRDIALTLQMSTKSGREKVVNQKTEATQQQITVAQKAGRESDVTIYNQQLTAQKQLILNSEKMTKEEQDRANLLLKEVDSYKEQALEAQKVIEKEQENLKTLEQKQRTEVSRKGNNTFTSADRFNWIRDAQEEYKNQYQNSMKTFSDFGIKSEQQKTLQGEIGYFRELAQAVTDTESAFKTASPATEEYASLQKHLTTNTEEYKAQLERLKTQYGLTEEQIKALVMQDEKLASAESLLDEVYTDLYEDEEQGLNQKRQYIDAVEKENDAHLNAAKAIEIHKNKVQEFLDSLKKSSLSVQDFATSITNLASAMASVGMALNQIKGIYNTYKEVKEGNMSLEEGLLSGLTSLGMLIPTIIRSIDQVKLAFTTLGVSGTAIIALLVVAIIGLVEAIKFTSEAFNADAIAAEKARKAAQGLASAFDEAREAYNKMKDSMSKYKEAKKSLSELTKGTEEYTEALKEANEAAMELITTGNLTANQYHYEDGLLVIDDAAMSGAVRSSEQTMLNAQAASQMGQAQALAAQTRADLTATRRTDDGLMANDLQYAIGALLGGSNYYDSHMEAEWNQQDEIERIAEQYRTIGEAVFAGSEMFMAANEQMQESIRAYCKQAQQAEIATQAYAEQIAQANLASSGYNDEAIRFASEGYRQEVSKIYDEVVQLSNDRIAKIDTEANQTAQSLWSRYRQATGLNAQLEGVEGTDSNRSFTYYDENHELQHVYVEQMATAIAASEAIEGLGESAKIATDFLNGLSDDNERRDFYEQAIANYSNGHVNFSAFAGQYLTGTEAIDTSAWDAIYEASEQDNVEQYIQGAIEAGTSVLEAYGIETVEDLHTMAEALKMDYTELFNDLMQGYNNSYESFNNFLNNQTEDIRELYENSELKNLDQDSARNIMGLLSNTVGVGGGEALTSIVSQMEQEELQSFAEGLSHIDWNTTNYTEFFQILSESGVEVGKYRDSLDTLYNSMRNVNQETLAAAATFYNELQKIADGLTDVNDTISTEDYAKIPEYMQQFFALTLDGTYKLLISAHEFQELVRQARIDEAVRQRDTLREQADRRSEFDYNTYRSLVGQSALSYRQEATGHTQEYYVSSSPSSNENSPDNFVVTNGTNEEIFYSASQANARAEELNTIYTQVLDNIDEDLLQQKIELIQQFTDDFDDELNEINGEFNEENVQRIEEYYDSLVSSNEQAADAIREAEEAVRAQQDAIALSAEDLQELREFREAGYIDEDSYNMGAYQIDQAQDTAMLDQEEWDEYSDYIQEAADALDGFNDNMSEMEADIVSKGIMKMNQAIDLLADNFIEWNDILNNSSPNSAEFVDALENMQDAVAMLLDTSEDFVSSEFLTDATNLEMIGRAAQGDAEAIDDLRASLSQDIIAHIVVDNQLSETEIAEAMEMFNSLEIPDIEVGVTLDGTDSFIQSLNALIEQTGMTVDQVNALCDSLGFEAAYDTTEVPYTQRIPLTTTHHERTNIQYSDDPEHPGEMIAWDDVESSSTEYVNAEGEYAAFAIATGSQGTRPQPKITGATRKASGSANNYSSSNKGGTGPGKSGGGGGKSSKKKPKDPVGEIERYHVINNQIEDNEKALDRLSKAKDRAYGRARLNAMDAEIAKQRESVELAERKLQEVEKYLELDSGAIAAFGAEFDTNGTIVNYDQLMQEQIDKYNAAVEAYNNSSMDENAEAVFQQAEDDYNAFTEALKQYEETQDLWYEQAQAVADAKAEVLQLELEKTNYKVEIGIEWEEEDIARLDFMLKRIEDDAHKAAEAIGLLGERTVDAMDKYNVYQQGFADTLRNLGVGNAEDVIARASAGEDLYGMIGGIVDPNQMAQAVDQMDDYISNMMSSLEDAQDSVDQAFEKVKDLFNENVKQMDTYIEKIEFCQKITKSYMNIVDIVGKKSLGITNEMLRTFNAESVTQAINNEAAAKAKMDSIQAQLMESQARLAQASGELEQKYWNEIIEEQEKELISATENFHQAWEDALQANLEAFENNIELVIEDFSNAVGDLNAMKAEWDLQKSLTDMWEPEYERWHQLSDLINDINKSVDENENLKYKQDLLDLETEIEQLQEQEAKLSEYDLNYLRLRYESKLAEIALEEAQAAKSQVRMSRDNEGNYSYVYTADEEAVNNAADDYRNKIYEMEKANEEYIDTLQQQLLEMHDKMLEDIQQAGELYGVGTQAYYDAVARIQETYVGQSEFIQLQMQNVFTNNQRLRDEDIVQYVAYTGDIAAENVDLQTSFGDTYMGIQTQTDDLQTYFNDTWLPALNETFDNVILKVEEYSQQNEVAMETAGTTMDSFRDRASQDILEVTERTTELTEETQNYGETAVDQFAKAAQAWQRGPGALLDSINAQAQAIANLAQQYTSLKSQMDAAAEAARQFAAAQAQARTSSSISYSSSGGGGGSSSGGGPSTSSSPTPSGGNAGIYQAISQLENGPHNSSTRDQLIALYNQIGRPESQWVAWARPGAKFDTGGYTGEWGDDGRLAVLHEKELVLNTKDTSNILTAVDVVRQLASSIDFNTMTASLATANIKSASGSSGTLEQRVEITANFPNATDRNEIEQAFQNIVNMASQYAQRKND